MEAEELRRALRERYDGEPFVEVVDQPPGVRDVRDTNLCRIHVAVDERTGRAMAFAAIDNLWKGAAGQAIQNLNLMLGFEETEVCGERCAPSATPPPGRGAEEAAGIGSSRSRWVDAPEGVEEVDPAAARARVPRGAPSPVG